MVTPSCKNLGHSLTTDGFTALEDVVFSTAELNHSTDAGKTQRMMKLVLVLYVHTHTLHVRKCKLWYLKSFPWRFPFSGSPGSGQEFDACLTPPSFTTQRDRQVIDKGPKEASGKAYNL